MGWRDRRLVEMIAPTLMNGLCLSDLLFRCRSRWIWNAKCSCGCEQPNGYVLNAEDCNDDDATVYLNAPELCDGQSNACALTIPSDETDYDIDGYVVCSIDGGGWDGDTSVIGGNDCDDFFNGVSKSGFGMQIWTVTPLEMSTQPRSLVNSLPIHLWTVQIVMILTQPCIRVL